MLHLIVSFVLIGLPPLGEEALPAAPLDVEVGRQAVELRKPLVVRMEGARLILFVRDLSGLDIADHGARDALEWAVPTGSVSAYLTGADGRQLKLEHTGYSYYRGVRGLLLTHSNGAVDKTPELYRQLELDAKFALKGVRLVWLDRGARQVWDINPGL
ncbi:MAG: hypothetical protein O7H40_06555 [Gammaproteobacteria bacterium]|nr:hypothetical protein [Gammaproteobacteria bacterium]